MHFRDKFLTRLWKNSLFILVVILLGIPVSYLVNFREFKAYNQEFQNQASYSLVHLSEGETHYQYIENDGPLVVMVHGGTIPLWNFDFQVEALEEAGYSILRYDHYGRGYSSRPQIAYDKEDYLLQLEELLKTLNIEEPFYLVGQSFGGAIAAMYASKHSDSVKKLVFIAPVYHYTRSQLAYKLAPVPVFGSWFVRVLAIPISVHRMGNFIDDAGLDSYYFQDRFRQQTRVKGFERSFRRFLSSDAMSDYKGYYQAIPDRLASNTVIFWGDKDSDIPREHIDKINKHLEYAQLKVYPEQTHSINWARAKTLNKDVLNFFSSRLTNK